MKKIKSQFLKQTNVGLPLVLELYTQVHYVAAAAFTLHFKWPVLMFAHLKLLVPLGRRRVCHKVMFNVHY